MATLVLIHGGGDVGWHWHLVDPILRWHGHDVVAPDLPCDDDTATLHDYADTVVEAIGERRKLLVVGHSYGGFTASLVAERRAVEGRCVALSHPSQLADLLDGYRRPRVS